MPVPIIPNNTEMFFQNEHKRQMQSVDYDAIDINKLPFMTEKNSKSQELMKVSNFEAGILFKLWKDSKAGAQENDVAYPSSVSRGDIIRLKASGLIIGGLEDFSFTPRGVDVIKTMVLSERSSFDKEAIQMPLQDILAENKKMRARGPRLSVTRKR